MSDERDGSSFFESLKAGLEEGIQFARGKLKLRTKEISDADPEAQPENIDQSKPRKDGPTG